MSLCSSVLVRAVVAAGVGLLGGALIVGLPGSTTSARRPVLAGDAVAGVVYYQDWRNAGGRLWRMAADGRAKTALPDGVRGEPSWRRHGGQRWFLSVRAILNNEVVTGGPRHELCAVAEDGRTAVLAMPPGWEPLPLAVRWPRHANDLMVSWVACRRGPDGRTIEAGICAGAVEYDAAGEIRGLRAAADPLLVRVPFGERDAVDGRPSAEADIWMHDWSPDGTRIVWDTRADRLRIADVLTGEVRALTELRGQWPVWSPDGGRIAFQVSEAGGGLGTVRPDGSDPRVVLERSTRDLYAVSRPIWSPTGDELLCLLVSSQPPAVSSPLAMDVLRVRADGRGPENLTAETGACVCPVAWRSGESW